jgi:hypothetical protein
MRRSSSASTGSAQITISSAVGFAQEKLGCCTETDSAGGAACAASMAVHSKHSASRALSGWLKYRESGPKTVGFRILPLACIPREEQWHQRAALCPLPPTVSDGRVNESRQGKGEMMARPPRGHQHLRTPVEQLSPLSSASWLRSRHAIRGPHCEPGKALFRRDVHSAAASLCVSP